MYLLLPFKLIPLNMSIKISQSYFLVILSDEMLNILNFLSCQTKPPAFLGPSALY